MDEAEKIIYERLSNLSPFELLFSDKEELIKEKILPNLTEEEKEKIRKGFTLKHALSHAIDGIPLYSLINYYTDGKIYLSSDNFLIYQDQPVLYTDGVPALIKGKKTKATKALRKIKKIIRDLEKEGYDLDIVKQEIEETLKKLENNEIQTAKIIDANQYLSREAKIKKRLEEANKILLANKIADLAMYTNYTDGGTYSLADLSDNIISHEIFELAKKYAEPYRKTIDQIEDLYYKQLGYGRLKRFLEKHPKIKKFLIALPLAAALFAGGIFAHNYLTKNNQPEQDNQQNQNNQAKPAILDLSMPDSISINSILTVTAKLNNTQKALLEIVENGKPRNITMQLIDTEPSYQLYKANIPIKEGIYKLAKLYAILGNETAVKQINKNYEVFDNPVIEFVKYDNAVKPGNNASIVFKATDTSGIKQALLNLFEPDGNVKVIKPKIANYTFVFSFPINKEPNYNFTATFIDPFGNKASYNGSITSLDNPRINSIQIIKHPTQGIVTIMLNATDTTGITQAIAKINNNIYNMTKTNGLYAYNLTFSEEPETKEIQLIVTDPYGMKSNTSITINWLLKDAFLYYANKHGINQTTAQNFYNNYENIVSSLYSNKTLLLPMLNTYAKNQTLFDLFENNFTKDPQIKTDRLALLSKATQLINQLKTYNLNKETIQALGNLTIAYEQLALPRHSLQELWQLTNASMKNKDIIDLKPLIIVDAANQKHVYASNNPARDYWIITTFLTKRPEYLAHPETYFWLNNALQQLAWSIFDNRYGPAYYNDTPGIADEKTWQIILSYMDYYGNSFPQLGNESKRTLLTPLYNTSKLIQWFGNKQDAKIAIWYLADLPAKWGNATHTYYGREAMLKFIQAMPKEYNEIINLYKEAVIDETPVYEYIRQHGFGALNSTELYKQLVRVVEGNPSEKYWWTRINWWGWLKDRWGHGLNNTVNEFIKAEETLYKKYNPAFNNNTSYNWDLIRFIIGFERGGFKWGHDWGGEWETYRKGYPLAFKAFGVPIQSEYIPGHTTGLYINHISDLVGKGAPGMEWAVSIPYFAKQDIKEVNPEAVIGYGNYFSLFSMKDGLIQDSNGQLEVIVQLLRDYTGNQRDAVYLWKKK